jgi:D-alanine--poly(phosphoribitol) ligase subunit 1
MLQSLFFDTAGKHPRSPALWVDGTCHDYEDLAGRARRIAAALAPLAAQGERNCVLFAYRSVHAYAGVLGVLEAGMAYVPLLPKFPVARNASVIELSGATVMLVDAVCAPQLPLLLPLLGSKIHVILLDEGDEGDEGDVGDVGDPAQERAEGGMAASGNDASRAAIEALGHDCIALPAPGTPYETRALSPDDLAYILFTSGTTGLPKGVMISHGNVLSYVEAQAERHPTEPGGRYSQFSDLTFDASTHDLYVCWRNHGCLYVPAYQDAPYLADFIREHAITHWNCVPSLLALMWQFRKLSPNAFPTLRVTLLGGEALPKALVQAWKRAAPNSEVINGYGPTETTVIMLTFAFSPEFLASDAEQAVPLGPPLPGTECVIVDPELVPVPPGARGELLIGGGQVGLGYRSANPLDRERFFERDYPGKSARRWYRTGDAVSDGPLGVMYHGRLDTQIKIRGNRIEVQEVEHVVLAACTGGQCAVIPWPLDADGKPEGLVAFVQSPEETGVDENRIAGRLVLHGCRCTHGPPASSACPAFP